MGDCATGPGATGPGATGPGAGGPGQRGARARLRAAAPEDHRWTVLAQQRCRGGERRRLGDVARRQTGHHRSATPACSIGWHAVGTGRLAAEPWGREHLVGIAEPVGSNARRTRSITTRSSSENMSGIRHALSTPTPCSPVIEPPSSMQHVDDLLGELLRRLLGAVVGRVEQHERVKVAVAGVEDVRHPESGARPRAARCGRARRGGRRGARRRPGRCSPGRAGPWRRTPPCEPARSSPARWRPRRRGSPGLRPPGRWPRSSAMSSSTADRVPVALDDQHGRRVERQTGTGRRLACLHRERGPSSRGRRARSERRLCPRQRYRLP